MKYYSFFLFCTHNYTCLSFTGKKQNQRSGPHLLEAHFSNKLKRGSGHYHVNRVFASNAWPNPTKATLGKRLFPHSFL